MSVIGFNNIFEKFLLPIGVSVLSVKESTDDNLEELLEVILSCNREWLANTNLSVRLSILGNDIFLTRNGFNLTRKSIRKQKDWEETYLGYKEPRIVFSRS